MVIVGRPRPRRWPRRLLCHNPLHQTVRAVRECRTVLTDGTVDEAQVLEEHQLAVRVQSVEGFVPEKTINFILNLSIWVDLTKIECQQIK